MDFVGLRVRKLNIHKTPVKREKKKVEEKTQFSIQEIPEDLNLFCHRRNRYYPGIQRQNKHFFVKPAFMVFFSKKVQSKSNIAAVSIRYVNRADS